MSLGALLFAVDLLAVLQRCCLTVDACFCECLMPILPLPAKSVVTQSLVPQCLQIVRYVL